MILQIQLFDDIRKPHSTRSPSPIQARRNTFSTRSFHSVSGCRCRQCACRAPRVLEFALEDDVKNVSPERGARGARRALVGLFGEGWCTQEFAGLPQKIRESVLKGVGKRTTPLNAFPLLFAAEHALVKLANSIEPWSDIVQDMIFAGRKGVNEILCAESEPCSLVTSGWGLWRVMVSASRTARGLSGLWLLFCEASKNPTPLHFTRYALVISFLLVLKIVLQTLVSSFLLRPHPTEVNAPLLPATSHVRVQVEQARLELLKWIGKRWLVIRQEKGFDPLEGWAMKEISDRTPQFPL